MVMVAMCSGQRWSEFARRDWPWSAVFMAWIGRRYYQYDFEGFGFLFHLFLRSFSSLILDCGWVFGYEWPRIVVRLLCGASLSKSMGGAWLCNGSREWWWGFWWCLVWDFGLVSKEMDCIFVFIFGLGLALGTMGIYGAASCFCLWLKEDEDINI